MRGKAVWGLLAFTFVALLTWVIYQEVTAVGVAEVGQPAPEIALPDLDGNTVRLSDYRGKAVLLYFWATWCHFCREEMPVLQAIETEMGDRLKVLAVNVDEPPEVAREYARKNGYTFTMLISREDRAVDRAYPRRGVPYSYFIDERGTLRMIFPGSVGQDMIKYTAERLLEGSL